MIAQMKRWAFLVGGATFLTFLVTFFSNNPIFGLIDPDFLNNPPLRAFGIVMFPLLVLTVLANYWGKIEIFWPSFSALVSLLAYMFLIACFDELKKFPTLPLFGVILVYIIAVAAIVLPAFYLPMGHSLLQHVDADQRNETRKKMRLVAFVEFFFIWTPISLITFFFYISHS